MLVLYQTRCREFRRSLLTFTARLNVQISFCAFLLVLWHLNGPLLIPRAVGEASMPNPSASEVATLEGAFTAALTKIDRERRTNRASQFSCTHFFSEFYQSKQIEPYVAFFQRIGLPTRTADANRDHFVYAELTREQLSSKGYNNFLPGDRLVIVFTTGTAISRKVTSFSATLFGATMP